MTAADDSGAAAAAAPAAPSTVETTTPLAPSAKLDAAAELKAAEMAFDLGADGFVGKSGFYDSNGTWVFQHEKSRHMSCCGVFSACYRVQDRVNLLCSAELQCYEE